MKKYSEYQNKFHKSNKLIDLFYYISFYAWEKLEVYSKLSTAPADEREFTNELVRTILEALCIERVQLPIRLFHAKDEKANGNDLEIVIPIGRDRNIILPCQAKRLYVEAVKDNLKSKYISIHHLVDKGKPTQKEQICSLLDYAKHEKIQGFPLYLFYNYTEFKLERNLLKELFGCTLVNAGVVFEKFYGKENKKITPFTFQEIHPPAKPLTTLLDLKKDSQLEVLFGKAKQSFNVKIYSNAELLKQPWWEEKCPPMSVAPDRRGATMRLEELFSQPKNHEDAPFNPKYRIMLLNEPEFFRYTKNIEL